MTADHLLTTREQRGENGSGNIRKQERARLSTIQRPVTGRCSD